VHLGEDYWLHRDDSLFLKLKRFNLRFVSKFITLTDQQRSVFEKHFPGKVARIPHGAWCETGSDVGGLRPGDRFHIAVVGDTYRDYGLLGRIISFFRDKYPAVVFDLVGMNCERLGDLQNAGNVICHGRLDKDAYREVIRGSLFVMLPLEFATANNALLEGLTAGVPVICSNVYGVREYLPEGDYVFESIEDLAMKFERRSATTQSERAAEAEDLIAYVRQNYDWEIIRSRVINYCLS
jgi:glycosyltransferase involved in cell wall biosynthesis